MTTADEAECSFQQYGLDFVVIDGVEKKIRCECRAQKNLHQRIAPRDTGLRPVLSGTSAPIHFRMGTMISHFMNGDELPLEELAGQRLMAGFDGTVFNDALRFLIRDLRVGGIILFARNIAAPETQPDQLAALCGEAQAFAAACGRPPLFIAVDQEGGTVARLKAPYTEFPGGNPAIADEADALRFARVTAAELLQVGITMNLAPVMDVAPEGMDSIMAKRSFGGDPERAARLGCAVIREMQARGLLAVAKHFPGIGRTVLDSHLTLPVMDEDMESLAGFDLPPFAAAIAEGVSGIMLSHILYPKIDAAWPASLSRIIAGDLLRGRMGYPGLVLSDDLDMGAITGFTDFETAIDRGLAADVDLILICRFSPKIASAFEILIRRLSADPASRRAGVLSVQRILEAKHRQIQAAERNAAAVARR